MNRRPLLSLAVLLAIASNAHASWGEKLDSIHFNTIRPDYGIVPRRGLVWVNEFTDRRAMVPAYGSHYDDPALELGGDKSYLRQQNEERLRGIVEKQSQAALARGEWQKARRLWEAHGARFGYTGWDRDRVEVLAHPNPPTAALRRYLAALAQLQSESKHWNEALATFEALAKDTTLPSWLREHALYQRASGLTQWLNYKDAVLLWQEQLRRFPTGEKREAALLMIARACLLHNALPDASPTGRAATEQLLRAFPRSRFRVAARGLLARVDFLEGRYEAAAATYCALNDGVSITKVLEKNKDGQRTPRLATLALIAYLRTLNAATDYSDYATAVQGIARTLPRFNATTGKAMIDRIVREPELAAPYFYYRLYHCDNKPADFVRLAELADRIAVRETLPPLIRVRLAEIYYQNHAYTKSVRWARTVTAHPDQKLRARALYVRAGCRYRLRRFDEARADLERLMATCPRSPLRHGTRELLALCAEGQEDFATALEQYFALDYGDDYAYLIDIRMPIPTLERYWQTHRTNRDLVAYSLALRHMRLEHWDEARHWLDRVPKAAYTLFVGRLTHDDEWSESLAEDGAVPRKVLANLSKLYWAAERARGREAKAAARFAYARAYYTQGLLQLYNAPLWQGSRSFYFNYFWNTAVVTPKDQRVVQRYMYQHEVYAHARRICLDIVRDYPHTKVAPQALYRAACAAERLSNLNEWWREPNKPYTALFDHNKEASKLMVQLVRRYPNHPLAKPARKYAGVFEGAPGWGE